MLYGIDVSQWNGTIDWSLVKTGFVICKATNKSNKIEPSFKANYDGATKAGIPVGAYKYVYANTVEKAKREGEAIVSVLGGRKLQAWFWIDMEDSSIRNLGKVKLTQIIDAVAAPIEKAGYKVGIYCNVDWYKNVLDSSELSKRYKFWIARYPSGDDGTVKSSLKPSFADIWQYSSKGKVKGIKGNVDMNILINDIFNFSGNNTQTSAPQDTTSEDDNFPLKEGSKGKNVLWLQQMLAYKFGFDCGAVDGKFGNLTKQALKNFQLCYGLEVDGIAGTATKKALTEYERITPKNVYAYNLQRALNAELDARLICDGVIGPKTIAACPVLVEGQTSQVIREYKVILSQVYKYAVVDVTTGYFTTDVTSATKKLQAAKKLVADGKVGPATWAAIGKDFS